MRNSSNALKLGLVARIILAFSGVLISVLCFEILFRLLIPATGPKKIGWTDRPYAYFMPEGATTLQDASPTPKREGVFRIAVVGDSFTFGPNMQLADTFPKKLEWMLNLNQEAPRVEVLNRGVCGASTFSEVEVVKQVLNEQPDLIVLEITLNDAEHHILSRDEREEIFGAPWLKWKLFSWWRSAGFVASRIHNSRTVSQYIDYHSKFFKDSASFDRFDRSIASIVAQGRAANVPMMAVLFPLFDFPIDDRYPFADVHKIVASSLAKHSLELLDLRSAYVGIPPERLQVIPGDDNHPNEIAHRIAAEHLLATLVDKRLVPESSVPRAVFRVRREIRERGANAGKVFKQAASDGASAGEGD